jgi:branched-chain amino acid transport system substrate-binding protein
VTARSPSRILPRERSRVKASLTPVLALFLALFGAAACAPYASETSPPRLIRIATQSPLSGPYQAEGGEAVMLAAKLAVQELGGALKKHGLRVELVSFDDRGDPEVGMSDARHIAGDPAIVAVVGPLTSDVALEVAAIYRDAGLAMVSPSSTHPALTERGWPNVFRVCGRDDVQTEVAARFVHQSLGAKRVHVVHDATVYGLGNADVFRNAAARRGLTLVAFEAAASTEEVPTVAAAIAATAPDVLYFSGSAEVGGSLFKEVRRLGVVTKFVGGDGIDSSELVRIAGEAALGAHYTSVAGAVSVHPQARGFTYEYQKQFDKFPEPFAAQAYDATAVVLEAIARAARGPDGVSRKTVVAALGKTRYLGYSGPIRFDEHGDLRQALYLVMKVSAREPDEWDGNREVKRLGIAPRSR